MNKKYEQQMKKWENLTDKLSDFGAADSEPRYHARQVLKKFILEGKNILPLTATQWELYSHSMDCDDAAKQLNEQMEKILKVVEKMTYFEVKEIENDYLW